MILFYTSEQRKQFPKLHELWLQPAVLGEGTLQQDGSMHVTYQSWGGKVQNEEVPPMFWRTPREEQWYAFWQRKGFHTNYYGYAAAIITFLFLFK